MVTQPDIPAGPEAQDPLDQPGINERKPGPDPRAQFNGAPPGPAFAQPDGQLASFQGQPRIRLGLTIAAALLGIIGLAASLAGVAVQVLPRKFSAAQQHQIMAWQVASRWRIWSAGKIFPASIGYVDSATFFSASPSGLSLDAHRAGIAQQSSCADSIDSVLAQVLERRGCTAVLRATYTDATGTFVVTLGVVVSRGTAPAPGTLPSGRGIRPGVEPVPFHGTLAARFGDRQRQLANAIGAGPYLILYTAGYTDGRRRDQVSVNPYIDSEMTSVAAGIAAAVGDRLGSLPPPPACPGAPGC